MKNKKYVVFSIDVESFTDTECVKNSNQNVSIDLLDGFDEYIKILDKHDIKGTLFTVGILAKSIEKKLKNCVRNGHELALHNYIHEAPADIKPTEFKSNLLRVKNELSNIFSTEISGFRAPFFNMDKKHLEIIKDLGFKYDSSFLNFSPARHNLLLDLCNFNEVSKNIYLSDNFFEFGVPVRKILGLPYPISGGGYIRLGPWPIIKRLIKDYLKKNEYYVFYLHPFELTKKKVPYLKNLKWYDKFYLKQGIKNYANNIEELILILKDLGYNFVTFNELANIIKNKKTEF